jgi:hypothetical protein
MISRENLQSISSSLPQTLFTHDAYLMSLGTVAQCLLKYAANPGAVVGNSPQRIKNMLCAILVHASGDCALCAMTRKHGVSPSERYFMVVLAAYHDSRHNRSSSSLNNVTMNAGAGRTLVLISEYVAILRSRLPSEAPPAEPCERQATA